MGIKIYITVLILFCLIWYIAAFIFMKHKKRSTQKWLEENPTASKIIVEEKSPIKNAGLYIESVNEKSPVTFYEMKQAGIYLLPGTHVIKSVYAYSKRGILHKNVTKIYGPVKVEIEVEMGKVYKYSFDKKNETFVFTDVTPD